MEDVETAIPAEVYRYQNNGKKPCNNTLPSLKLAREAFEKSRPHRLADPTQPSGHRLAMHGEDYDEVTGEKARPYSVCCTGFKWAKDFGSSVNLYFNKLRSLCILFFFAGFILLPAFLHNMSYFPRTWLIDTSIFPPGTSWLVTGAAVGAQREDLDPLFQGLTDILMVLMLLLVAAVFNMKEENAAADVEMSQPRAHGYAVCVLNPIEDERNPDAYLPLFRQYGEVVMITMVLNNGKLIQSLAKERELEERCPNIDVSAFQEVKEEWWEKALWYLSFGKWEGANFLLARWLDLSRKIDTMVEDPESFKVKRVYCVFNSQDSQRACLMGKMSGLFQYMTLPGGVALANFRGRLFKVVKAKEPSEVVWENLHYEAMDQWYWRLLSMGATCAFLLIAFLLQYKLTGMELNQLNRPPWERDVSLSYMRLICMGPLIVVINGVIPFVMEKITNLLEVPHSHTERRESITLKVVIARCLNIAVFLYWSTPYSQVMRPRNLACIVLVLLCDCLAPLITAMDIPGLVRRRFQAPFAIDQKTMDFYFTPQAWDLAERSTDLIKTVFLGLYFTAVIPGSLFITSLALLIRYWVDKAVLLRSRPPSVDTLLPGAVRDSLAVLVVIHTLVTRSFFANWPYKYNAERVFCGIWCSHKPWLTSSQWYLVSTYSILVWVTIIFVAQHGAWGPIRSLWSFITLKPTFHGEASDMPYRSCVGVQAYIPMVHNHLQPDTEPYFASNVEALPKEYVPIFSSGDRSLLVSNKRKLDAKLFSVVKHYQAGASTISTTYGSVGMY